MENTEDCITIGAADGQEIDLSPDASSGSPASSPGRPCFANLEKSLPPLPQSTQSDAEQESASFTALDSLLHDMKIGKQGSDLQAPHEYSKSMVSLSARSLIPAVVTPHKQQASCTVQTDIETRGEVVPRITTPQSIPRAATPVKKMLAQHLRGASCASTSSSSIYSQSSSTSVCTRIRDQKSASSPETQYTPSLHTRGPNVSPGSLALRSSQLFQSSVAELRRDSDAFQAETFLLNDSSSESRSSSPSSAHAAGSIKSVAKKRCRDEKSPSGASASAEEGPLVPFVLQEKAAKVLGFENDRPSPQPPSFATSADAHSPALRSYSDYQSWSPLQRVRNMVSTSSSTASGASSTTKNSPPKESIAGQPHNQFKDLDTQKEDLLIRKRGVPVDGPTRATGLDRDICDMSEDALGAPAGPIKSKDLTTINNAPVSKRSEFRPLSLKIGDAFNPFNQGEKRYDDVGPTPQLHNSIKDSPKQLRNDTGSSEKARHCANADIHIFNANFVAVLTSKAPPDTKDHPAFRADPFSVQRPKPSLQRPLASKLENVSHISNWSAPTAESQRASEDDGKEKAVMVTFRSVYDQTAAMQSRVLQKTSRKDGLAEPSRAIAVGRRQKSSSSFRELASPTPVNEQGRSSTKLAAQQSPQKWSPRGIPTSPSFSRFRIKGRTPKSGPLAELRFASSSFDNDDTEGKRNRGLSNLLRLKLPNKTLVKGSGDILCADSNEISEIKENYLAQIQRVRRRLNAQSQDHDFENIQPRHPATGRGWHSRNLRCTSCSEVTCSCCGGACCAFRTCVLRTENLGTTASVREAALREILVISRYFPVGKETPTFIQCTHDTGCGELVCPDCCGMCPDHLCGDIQCKKCKSEPWARCEWHTDHDMRFELATQPKTVPRPPEKAGD